MDSLKHRIEKLTGAFNPKDKFLEESTYSVLEEFKISELLAQKILIKTVDSDNLPAYLVHPKIKSKPTPGILALHQTTVDSSIGAKEVIGLCGNKNYAYGLELANIGYTVIAPDYPFFGDYKITVEDIYERYGYESVTMKGILNHLACINILSSLKTVNPRQIGCIGHSLGGTNTLFISFFDRRIKASVVSAGFTTFSAYAENSPHGNLEKWSQKNKYMPNTKKKFNNNPNLMPFDFPELLQGLSPRPLFLSTPKKDEIFSFSGALKCVKAAQKKYIKDVQENRIVHKAPNSTHDFPTDTRIESYHFLKEKLKQWI